VVEVSAKNNINLDGLLEHISLTAMVLELKAPVDGTPGGVVLESSNDEKRGVLATFLVQTGTLRVGDVVVAGKQVGKSKRCSTTASGSL